MRGDAAPELARGRSPQRRAAVRVHVPKPASLSLAVVLGLVLLPRSSGGASTPSGRAASSRRCWPSQREDGFIGHTIFWNTPLRGLRRLHLQRHLPRARDDLEHPAAGAGLGVEHRRRRPRVRAADRRALRLARRASRPRRRRPDLDRAARRVRARRLSAVRRDLGQALARPARLRAARARATGASATTCGGSPRPAGRCAARS